MPRTYFAFFTRDDGETEIEVEYSVTGGCPAHYGSLTYPGHPAEDPEVEILASWELPSEEDVTLTEAEDRRMCQWIVENPEDDGADPDDERDRVRDEMERGR